MDIREWMNENSALVTVAAVALLVVSLAIVVMQGGGGPQASGDAYYYDTVTEEVFEGEASGTPPIESPDGNEAVRAHFYTCGECSEEERFLGYYERYTEEAKEVLERSKNAGEDGEPDPEAMMEVYEVAFTGRLYSTDLEEWVVAESPEGRELSEALQEECGEGERLSYCAP